jgi:hypothetical protein
MVMVKVALVDSPKMRLSMVSTLWKSTAVVFGAPYAPANRGCLLLLEQPRGSFYLSVKFSTCGGVLQEKSANFT